MAPAACRRSDLPLSPRSRPIAHSAAALIEADALAAEGRFLDAVDVLSAANRRQRDDDIERRLVSLRSAAFGELDRSEAGWPWTDEQARPANGENPPTLEPGDLSAETMRDSIMRYGYAHVRGLIGPPRIEELREAIDHAYAAYDAYRSGTPLPELPPSWRPFPEGNGGDAGYPREWLRDRGGGVFLAESPPALFAFLEIIEAAGVRQLVTAYLGERPALTLGKSTLRRMEFGCGADWHQDGSFLGTNLRTINLWLALSDCGADTPGLEFIARRLDSVAPTGTLGASEGWTVAPDVVAKAARGEPIRSPEFRAGDALLFDELFLHRTAVVPTSTKQRYAVETWFFAPSAYPDDQIPIVW